jgi:hypothetical protein
VVILSEDSLLDRQHVAEFSFGDFEQTSVMGDLRQLAARHKSVAMLVAEYRPLDGQCGPVLGFSLVEISVLMA